LQTPSPSVDCCLRSNHGRTGEPPSPQSPWTDLLHKLFSTRRGVFVKVKLIRCTTLSMVLGLAVAAAHADVVFSDKFEAYSLAGFGTAQEGWAITNSEIRSGNYAAKMTLQPNLTTTANPAAINTTLSIAAETKHTVAGTGRTRAETKGPSLERGKDYTIRFSNKLDDNFDTDAGGILFQIHKRRAANDRSGHQPLNLHVRRGEWWLSVHSDASPKGKRFDLGPAEKGKYSDWELNVKISNGNDGRVQVKRNGVQLLDYTGPDDFKNDKDKKGPYVKFGIYRPQHVKGGPPKDSREQTVYYDRVEVIRNN
jgi:hypothetical protein